MNTYVIGDLQGCQRPLMELMSRIDLASPASRILFAGDLVNRGPDSLATLRTVIGLGQRARTVLGNHDLHLLAVSQGIRKTHRSDTLNDILQAPDCNALLDWLRRQPLAIMQDGHLLVHAGVAPQWSAAQTLDLAQEVETALRGPNWIELLRAMYGNKPNRWDDALTGTDRLRCIVNILTRIRFCAADGTMDFVTKEAAANALPDMMPWFEVPNRRTEDVTMVFGHWSTLGLVQRPNLISLDTGCVWGGKLTAVCLEDRSVIQVDCPQCQAPG
ncbi:MAG: symmetrical bis(5'-nucleosyl)-tetraphosphatase [Glaciimonas sp.]|nr:symmetrical bis(5'-nucleosyl)-tetraphosphatase [Glaciimonas sp.]